MRNDDDPSVAPPSSARRRALKCMAWAGGGVVWSLVGGVPRSMLLGDALAAPAADSFQFAQISDNHFGFNKDANPDVVATARESIARINALPNPASFVLHTGDITHLSKPAEFDLARQVLSELKVPVHFTPGEHDVLDQNPGALYRQNFPQSAKGDGWYSFDAGGVHFICLINVLDFASSGLGALGAAQLEWLAEDVKRIGASTPLVVYSHIPLWSLYREWGWGTGDAEQAFAILKRFGSVTVLNGHIHQVIQKIEGNVSFHTAMSTAYPQPRPGEGPSPGPLKLPPDRLRTALGVRAIDMVAGTGKLAVVDKPLAES